MDASGRDSKITVFERDERPNLIGMSAQEYASRFEGCTELLVLDGELPHQFGRVAAVTRGRDRDAVLAAFETKFPEERNPHGTFRSGPQNMKRHAVAGLFEQCTTDLPVGRGR